MRRVDLPRPDPTIHSVGSNRTGEPGRRQMELLVHFGLRPEMLVLEIGCGIGRLVYELAPFLDTGSYTGFDISPRAIEWLNEHYAPRLSNFRFELLDVYNARYNRDGTESALAQRWPYEDSSFDFACAFSVFTHMRLPEVERYLMELRRVMKMSARAVVTFLLVTARDQPPLRRRGELLEPLDDVSFTSAPKMPERRIAFREDAVRGALERAHLSIADEIAGNWHGWPTSRPRWGQDLLVLTPE